MLDKINRFASEYRRDKRFGNVIYRPEPPAAENEIDELRNLLAPLDPSACDVLTEFYRLHNGFVLSWHSVNRDRPTFGSIDLVDAGLLTTNLRHAPDDFLPFDSLSDDNLVAIRLVDRRISLFYHDAKSDKHYPLEIDLGEYFRMMDESRGLSPWQQLSTGGGFRMKKGRREEFFADLNLLFPDADFEKRV